MEHVLIVFGTRPEVIKLGPVVRAMRDRRASIRLCSTGQHEELLVDALRIAGFVPDISIRPDRDGASLNALLAALLPALSQIMEQDRPDRVLVQGDTTSALAAAIAAHHLQIPVAHVEAGLRSGDNRAPWPEEFNRRAIGVIADLHFAPTPRAAAALIAEGHPAASIRMVGNTAIDALLGMRSKIAGDPMLCAEVTPAIAAATGTHLILVTCHRRENVPHLGELAAAIRALSARPDVHFVLPLHANPRVADVLRQALAGIPNVSLLDAVDYPCFVRLLDAAHIVVTDSGGVQEEAPALGKPVLILRDTTERMEGVEAGTARLIGMRAQRIVAETQLLLDSPDVHAHMARVHFPYGDGRAAERIADALVGERIAEESAG